MVKMTRILALCIASFLCFSAQPSLADVRCVQEFLSGTAFDPGPVDGLWGRKTRTAIEDFLDQAGLKIPGGVTKGTADEVCELMTGEEGAILLASAKWRKFGIDINERELADFTGRKYFDFSNVNIAKDANFNCFFNMARQDLEDGRIKQTVAGTMQIIAGRIKFLQHKWYAGEGLADETYLENEATFVIDQKGRIYGIMPFFYLFHGKGDIVQRPTQVTLSGKHKTILDFPLGITSFRPDREYDGLFQISYCFTPEETPETLFK